MTLTSADIKNLKPSIEEYHEIDWNDVYDLTNPDCEYSNLYLNNKFENQLKLCLEQNNPNRAKIFQILSIVTSPLLSDPKNRDNPYIPHMNFNGIRSHLLDDLSDDDIEFLKEIVSDIKTTALKARINDTLWLRSSVKDIKYAEGAIMAYSNYPLSHTDFINYFSYISFARAIYLSIILGKKGEIYLKNIIDKLYNALIELDKDETAYSLKLSEILIDNKKLLSEDRRENIRQKLESIAKDSKLLTLSQSYYEETIKWCSLCKKEVEIPRLYSDSVQRLETYIFKSIDENKEITVQIPSIIEDCIRILRKIPKKNRIDFHVDERLNKLLQLKDKSGLALTEKMTVLSTKSIDIKYFCQYIQSRFTGKSIEEVMLGFCFLIPPTKKSKLREESKEFIKHYPLQYIVKKDIVDLYGHRIGTIQPPNLHDLDAEESQSAIHYQMIVSYRIRLDFYVKGYILPALDVINTEHHINQEYIQNLVADCPFISEDRAAIWIKGLLAGFNQDYVTSTHMLVPQFEHFIREILHELNIQTTHIDDKNIETEMALGSLFYDVGTSELEKFFGEDLYFELKTLLVDRIGPNLRNRVAHGLMNEYEFHSYSTIYLWWMCLRLVFLSRFKASN